MAALLAPARFSVIKLVHHNLWSNRAPLYGNLGCRMAGGTWEGLELQETPCLHPRCYYKDIGHPQGPRDPGQDHAADGPLVEGSPRGPGGRRQGARGAREVRAASGGEEEDEAVARSYHDMVLSGKLR